MEYTWYTEDDSHTAASYAARAVLPYLLVANVRAANTAYETFVSLLAADSSKQAVGVQDVSSASGTDVRVFPSLPLLNFLGLLLLAVQRGSPELFRQLQNKYASHIAEVGMWDEALELIAEMYFGIQRPRQSNPLLDMMGSLFGGAGGMGGGAGQSKPPVRRVEAPPAAPGLD